MKQRNNPNITKMFAGFRMSRKKVGNKIQSVPILPKLQLTKNLLKQLEKAKVLTQLQHDIVKHQLEKCTDKASPGYIARLDAVLEKPIGEQNVK
jgi:hypothetical protein